MGIYIPIYGNFIRLLFPYRKYWIPIWEIYYSHMGKIFPYWETTFSHMGNWETPIYGNLKKDKFPYAFFLQ